MSSLLKVTDEDFDKEIINSDLPVLVDFWAEWCGPCKMLGPVIEELAIEYKGKIKFAKMDVDANRSTPVKFGIRNIPTILFIKDGKVVNTVVGSQPKKNIDSELKKLL